MIPQKSEFQSWTCPTCKQSVTTPFCPTCGERPLDARDLTLHGLGVQIAKALSSIDSRLLRSLKTLVMEPGALTVAFMTGRRQPYIAAFPLFLMANVLFFATQSQTGLRIFSTSLDMHLYDQMWSNVAQLLVKHRLAALGTTLDLYAPVFNQAISVNAKSLIGLMVLPFAIVPAAIFWRMDRPFAVHIVFSLHFFGFLLLLLSVPLAVAAVDGLLGGSGTLSPLADDLVSMGLLLTCGAYLYLAAGKVYDTMGIARVLQTIGLALAVVVIFLGYRFALLPITLYST